MNQRLAVASRALAGFALAATACIPLAEHTFLTDGVSMDGRWDTPFLRNWTEYDPESSSRTGNSKSSLLIDGLLANAPVSIDVAVATGARRPFRLIVTANGVAAPPARIGAPFQVISIATRSDRAGTVVVRFVSGDDELEPVVRLSWFRIDHSSGGRIPSGRWILYGLLLTLVAGLARLSTGEPRGALLVLLLTAGLTVVGLGTSRLHALASLPGLVVALAVSLPFAFAATRWIPRRFARWVVAAFCFRMALVLHPAFPCIDGTFHTHNIWKFRQGQVMSSRSPSAGRDALAVPYPPALYALLSPIFGLRLMDDEMALRVAMGVLEGSAPLLVHVLMRRGGASVEASAAGAVTSAVMPEGLLVLAKGIAANIFGNWLTTLAASTVLAGQGPVAVMGVLTLAFLSHFGAALTLAGLLAVWLMWSLLFPAPGAGKGLPAVLSRVAVAGSALALAWLVYYREVGALTSGAAGALGADLQTNPSAFLHVRWIQVGKTLQDLLLKFGGAPLVLAAIGLRRATERSPLLGLVKPWILAGTILGALAMLTPIPLRFEYFLMAPVSVAAGLGAESLSRTGRDRWVQVAWAISLAIQLVIGALLMTGRFELISVIMESDRWPFPARIGSL